MEPGVDLDRGEGISYNPSLEKHSLVMSQADPEHCTEPVDGVVKC